MKKRALYSIISLCVLSLSLMFVTGCSKKTVPTKQSTTYTVTFMIDTDVYTTKQVKKGQRLSEPEKPTLGAGQIFVEWVDSEGTAWNFQYSTITGDLTLYCSYRTVSNNPQDLAMENVAFTSNLVWTQAQKNEYKVEIQNAKTNGAYEEIAGSFTFDEETYQVKFTPTTIPHGGYYNVKVTDTTTNNEVTAANLIFAGEGTATNPYLVCNSESMYAITTADVNNGYYVLTENINFDTFYDDQVGKVFNANFNGNKKTITLASTSNTGIFYTLGENANVSNLVIAGAVSTKHDSIGCLANYNNGTIDHVTVTANMTSTSSLTGSNYLERALNEETKDGERGIAGLLVGTNETSGRITNTKIVNDNTSKGCLKSAIVGGGVVGYNKGTISVVTGEVVVGAGNAILSSKSTSSYSYCGGVVGINAGTVEKVSLSENSKVLAQRYVDASSAVAGTNNSNLGGICGYNMANGTISECAITGIRFHGDENVGGIVGNNAGIVNNCAVYGTTHKINEMDRLTYVCARLNAGGIAGLNTGSVSYCYTSVDVYSYQAGTAYSVAQNATNSVYKGSNVNPDPIMGSVKDNYGTGAVADFYEHESQGLSSLTNPTDGVQMTEEVTSATNVVLGTATTSANYLLTLGDKWEFVEGAGVVLSFTQSLEQEATITVNLYKDGVKAETATVKESGSTVAGISKSGYKFVGWAVTETGEVVFEAGQSITIDDLEPYKVNDEYNLYAVYEVVVHDNVVRVAVWGRYVTTQEADTIKGMIEAILSEGVIVEFTYFGSEYNAVANLGAKINELGNIDIILGSGTNISTTGTVVGVTTKAALVTGLIAETGRQAALLGDYSEAIAVYSLLTGLTNESATVTFQGSEAQTISSLLGTTATVPTAETVEGKTFKGWATSESGEVVVNDTVKTLNYAAVSTYLTDGAVTFYPIYQDALVEETIQITVKGDADSIATLGSIALNAVTMPVCTPATDKFFLGWTSAQGAVKADFSATTTSLTYNDVKDMAVEGVVTLYPIYVSKVLSFKVSTWRLGKWVTADELAAIKTGFMTYLTNLGYVESDVTIEWTEEDPTITAVADLGTLANQNNYDLIIGAGANVYTQAGVINQTNDTKAAIPADKVAAGRQAALLTNNEGAMLLYLYLTGEGYAPSQAA